MSFLFPFKNPSKQTNKQIIKQIKNKQKLKTNKQNKTKKNPTKPNKKKQNKTNKRKGKNRKKKQTNKMCCHCHCIKHLTLWNYETTPLIRYLSNRLFNSDVNLMGEIVPQTILPKLSPTMGCATLSILQAMTRRYRLKLLVSIESVYIALMILSPKITLKIRLHWKSH